jgi:drug/metabolite transporter (DMT)-like permease
LNSNNRVIPILQALLVTFLWSTSFVIIKWGLVEITPINYAGLRYFTAFLCFLPFLLKRKYFIEIKRLKFNQIKKLILLGLIFYTVTQGAQFLGLSMLSSVTVSLMLNFTPLVVAVMGLFLINEKLSVLQWIGSSIFIIGILTYFLPISLAGNKGIGLVVMFIGVLANAGAAVIGREINRSGSISPFVVTFISMGAGAVLLLISGFVLEGSPAINMKTGIYILWLAVINTAFAFTLWNLTLRSLTAIESSIINGTMLIQIAILSYYFLAEDISIQEGIGMVIAAAGVVLVQIKRKKMPEAAL